MEAISRLSSNDLRKLAAAFRSKRLKMPATVAGLNFLALADAEILANDFVALHTQAFTESQVATLLEAIAYGRTDTKPLDQVLELVASGPEVFGVANRDTSVVVQHLFRLAQQSVLLVGYSVYQGQQLFTPLAEAMRQKPGLEVVMCLNIGRDGQDDRSEYEVRHRFMSRFKQKQWPAGFELPKIYFYPLSIDPDPSRRASLHAKCIVVDQQYAFVSSANFTERGQKRNIEVGLRVESTHIATGISNYIFKMIEAGILQPLV